MVCVLWCLNGGGDGGAVVILVHLFALVTRMSLECGENGSKVTNTLDPFDPLFAGLRWLAAGRMVYFGVFWFIVVARDLYCRPVSCLISRVKWLFSIPLRCSVICIKLVVSWADL